MKKYVLAIIVLLMFATDAFAHTSAFDIEWWSQATYSNQPGNTLKKWAEGMEGRVGNLGTGNIYYVDSGVANEGDGSSWANAKDTLNEAIDLCTADNGDVIYVAQGHSETMGDAADEVDIDVSGVTIIGCGEGLLRPTFDYTATTTGAFAIGADDITIINLRFHANVTDVNEAIEIEAGSEQVSIIGCLFDVESEGTDEFLECIDSSGGAGSDRLSVIGCEFYMGAGACNAAICTKDSDYSVFKDNVTFGDYAVACIYNTTQSNHILIENNRLFNGTIGGNAGLNSEPGIELAATTTGIISNNFIACNLATKAASVVAADCYLFENYYNEDESSAGTGGIIGTASADD